jgi:tetratricopeptide (TPR) repeat protein/predicted Ser/Thr protein kinase
LNQQVTALFHELANRSPSERDQYYDEHEVPATVREELESLLRFDRTSDHSLDEHLASAARQALIDHSAPPEGTRYGPYRLVRLVGRGGMGAVYEAEQGNPRRTVALKVVNIRFASPELMRRFEQESHALGRLHHPGIAQIYEAGTADTGFGSQPYFAMEFIRGETLKEYCESHHLDARQRLELMALVAEAAHHAHQRGIIHRDLKPGNILVNETGQPKILDFGVARVMDNDGFATRQTDVGQLVGTLAYMSPEQVSADPLELDIRSDVYALGVILYELLAGRSPYKTEGKLHDVARAIREDEPVLLGTIDRGYRGDVETIVAKALEKEKSRRYASAFDLAADIRRHFQDEPVIARSPSAVYQLRKFGRRHKPLVAGIAAVFIALIAGVIASAWQASHARAAEHAALRGLSRATAAEQAAARERDRALAAGRQAAEERNRAHAAEARAVQERNHAVREKQRADNEAATARAINQFLQFDLLAQAGASNQTGPNTRPDPDLKVRTALDRAAVKIPGRFKNQPVTEAALRFTIGKTYLDLGLYAEAEAQLEPAIELTRRALGEEHPYTLDSMNMLAGIYQAQGRYAKAEPLFIKLVDTRRRLLGEGHDVTRASMNNLALIYSQEGKYALAEPLQIKLLELRRRLSGAEDPKTLINMVNLALTYMNQGKYAQAEPLHTKVVEIRTRVLGPEHPSTLNSMRNLAALYYYQGRYDQARNLLTTALEAQRRVRGEEHPETLFTANSLGRVYDAQGEYRLAEPLFLKVVDAGKRVLGPENPDTLVATQNLANLYRRQHMDAEAEDLFLKILQSRRRVLGPAHPDTAGTAIALSRLWLDQRKYKDAEPLLREVVSIYETARPDAWVRFHAQSLLGATLAGQMKYSAAESLMLSGYQGLVERESTIPAVDRRNNIAEAGERIVRLYEDWGQGEKAAEWRRRLQPSGQPQRPPSSYSER